MASVPPSTCTLRQRTSASARTLQQGTPNVTNVTQSFKNTCGACAIAKSLGEYTVMELVKREIAPHYASGNVVFTINGERMGPGHVSHDNSLYLLY